MNSTVPLSSICKYIRGITFKPEDKVEIGTTNSVICMRTKNIQIDLDESDLIAVPKQFVKRNEQYLRNGDILISSANSWELVGKCVKIPELNYKATAGGFISILRLDGSLVDPDYLYFWLSSNSIQLKVRYCARQTTNIANLNASQFLELTISLPPLPEQKRIAAILDKADAVRRKRKETIRLLDEFLRSVFLEMFGDPEKNEKGWEIKTFKDISTLQQGLQIPIAQRKIEPGENRFLYITIQYLNGGKAAEYVENPRRSVICKKDDVLMSRTGNTGMVITNVEGVFHNNFFRIDFNRDLIEKPYLIHFLRMPKIKQIVVALASTTTIPDLNHSDFFKVKIPIPPYILQKKFAQIVEKTEQQKELLKQSFDEIENGFNSMMQKAFQGEL